MRLSNLMAISAFGCAVGVELVEVGADRRLHRVDEVAQDAVLVEALDRLQARPRSRRSDRGLARLALAPSRRGADRTGRGTAATICDRERARACAASPTCSPANRARGSAAGSARSRAAARRRATQPGGEHQRVVAVVLGGAAHHHDEAGFERAPASASRSTRARRRRAPASCRGTRRSGAPAARDLIGALVDHPEAHVLQHRHALRQRDRAAVAPHLQADAGLLVPDAR